MKRIAALAALALLTACWPRGTPTTSSSTAEVGAGAPDIAYTVVGTFDHDTEAFTQGLDFRGETLFESTGLEGRSTLSKIDLFATPPEVLKRVALDDRYFGEGSVVLHGKVWWITWQDHRGFVYRAKTLKRTGRVTYRGEGWGLTTDGRRLLMSNGTDTLRWRDPKTFGARGKIEVTDGGAAVDRLNELEWVDGAVFANVFQSDRVARIDPTTGEVTGWLDLSPLKQAEAAQGDVDVTNGIAYIPADDRLFVTGKLWAHIYEIELAE